MPWPRLHPGLFLLETGLFFGFALGCPTLILHFGCLGMSEKTDLLTVKHFACFGSIVYTFARLEFLIQSAMADVAGIDDTKVLLLTKALSYSQKRDTLYSYLKFYEVPESRQAKIKKLLDRADKHTALRNNIAHALWREGIRPASIRAGYMERYGKGRIVGYDEDDKDYTLKELGDIADELRSILNSLIRYLRDSGKIAETKQLI
jgi:hypothetical protein